jgi:6-phosphofructokinase 1
MQEIELNFTVSKLGEGRITSPITGVRFVDDEDHVLYHSDFRELKGYLDAGIKPLAWKRPDLEKIYSTLRA